MKEFNNIKNPREIAFLAIINSKKNNFYIKDFLMQFHAVEESNIKDFRLSRQLASGVIKREATLLFLLKELVGKPVRLKLKEKICLFLAIYQCFFFG